VVFVRLTDIIDEDFQDYKKPSMMLATCKCNWKCLTELNLDISICQNQSLGHQAVVDISVDKIIHRYVNNPITQAIVIGGLEPMLQFEEVLEFIDALRKVCDDDIVIYTGYYPYEIEANINRLNRFSNIFIKFGRYIPNRSKRYDDVLGIELVSDNQYGIRIS